MKIGLWRLVSTATAMGAMTGALFACAQAQAATQASIVASFSRGRGHADTSLTVTLLYKSASTGLPAPLRQATLRLPAGLGLEIPHFRTCRAALLMAHGVNGCPAQSLIGAGSAVIEGMLGTKSVRSDVTLHAFLGPLRNLEPILEIFSEGADPIATQVLFTASAQPTVAPYGEELVVSIPPISTVPNEPYLSVLKFSLTIGGGASDGNSWIRLPAHCPAGGLPFAAAFTYADGSSGSAKTTARCPRPQSRRPAT